MLILNSSLLNLSLKSYFNTSHVNVNRIKEVGSSTKKIYFNTSHVNVNLMAYNLGLTYFI